MSNKNDNEYIFDDIMEEIGNDGKFQNRFVFIFVFLLAICATMAYMNLILAFVIPNHWCKVPGRELTNMTMAEWKNYTIPRRNDSIVFDKCKMYNVTSNNTIERGEIVDCIYGWEFDTTWYRSTAPSQESWVCDKELNVANSFAMMKIGATFGIILFGQLGDIIGRKKVLYLAIVTLAIGRMCLTFTSNNLGWFLTLVFIGSMPSLTVFFSPLNISVEISKIRNRSSAAMYQVLGWIMGLCLMPMIMWLVCDWIAFIIITSLPCGLFILLNCYIVESPRWLANKRKTKRCMKVLGKIAKVNGKVVTEDLEAKVMKIGIKKEQTYGILSLLSSWRLAKNTAMLTIGWVSTFSVYTTVMLNVSYLGGNPFLNHFLQNIAELPAGTIGSYCCDYVGRRWTNVLSFFMNFIGSFALIFVVKDPENGTLILILVVFLKCAVGFSLYALRLQSSEIYPTCVRQTGQSVSALAAHSLSIFAPYIVYLGTSINPSWPYIICACFSLIGIIAGFSLPETVNSELPETLADGSVFGKDQKYFGIGTKQVYTNTKTEEN